MSIFVTITQSKAGIIPAKFCRVPCVKRGGVRFELKGNPNWITATVLNVAGAGDVTTVRIEGHTSDWRPMLPNWGQVWQIGGGNF
ncbi:hypothetical protein M0R45_035615 [Rubus argutus]|uniref:Expansin n=1 Tax=Rubus argutus TaxID=59490 RepID=A0AAW1VVE2_RUBAR